MAKHIKLNEDEVKKEFMQLNSELVETSLKTANKELKTKQKRLEELSHLIQVVYEDKVNGKIPENICIDFIEKYSREQTTLKTEITELESKIQETTIKEQNVDDFIQNIKKYIEAPTLTREMCYELIDKVIVGGVPLVTKKERTIEIVYKVDITSVLRHKLKK